MNMKKTMRNLGAILAVGGVGVYSAYKMAFGKCKRVDGAQVDVSHVEKIPFQRIFIESRDEITLAGKYYHFREHAPLILFFHGYHGTALRDGNGILSYAKNNGYNILLVDHRAHGKSGGRCITFGIKERYDCLDWIRYANRRFGDHTPIILAGISMGASTVLMASDLGLPANVKGIMADCPYSEPKEILKKVMIQMKYPVNVTYTAVRLGGKFFGKFDIEEHSALESMKNCYVPVLFIHGDEDELVPYEMSKDCYEACVSSEKRHVVVKGAAHGMSYCVDKALYEKEVEDFLNKVVVK